MLVLQRLVNERVVTTVPPSMNETRIEVEVCRCNSDRARLGFEMPDHVVVFRKELQQAIDRQQAAEAAK